MKKKLFALTAAAVLFLCFPLVKYLRSAQPVDTAPLPTLSPTAEPTPTPEPEPTVVRLRFSATGDNLIHNGIYEQAHQRALSAGGSGYDFSYCFDHVRSFYAGFDINWLNQETLVNGELEPSTYPCFSTPAEMGQAAYDTGFRVFSLSNNHSYDKGAAGIAATRRFWASMPEDAVTVGLYDPMEPAVDFQDKDGVTIAYLSYTEHTNGIRPPQNAEAEVIYTNQTELIEQQVREASSAADLVIVSTHWGVEGSHRVTDQQRQLAQNLADWGADVVIGTGPHMVQDAQWLTAEDGHDCFVAYSLGNFLNAQSNADCMIGAVLSFEIVKTTQPDSEESETHIETPLLHPIINHYDAHYANVRVYLYEDYTDELSKTHGVRSSLPGFSRNYIDNVLKNSISEDYLAA